MKYNRSKIMKAAWARYADEHRGMTFDRKFFASCLRRAWKKERRNVERVRAILAGEKVTKCCSVPLLCGDVTVDFGGCLGPAYVSGNTFPHKDAFKKAGMAWISYERAWVCENEQMVEFVRKHIAA